MKKVKLIVTNIKNVEKRKDANKMLEYQKLLIAEAMEAQTIEIAKRNKMGFPILNNKHYQGCACTSDDKKVWVFYGDKNGEDDKVISPDEFNKNWVITNIIFF